MALQHTGPPFYALFKWQKLGTPGIINSYTVIMRIMILISYAVHRVPNLEEGKQGPVLAVKARSMMPYCHFELEDSDYITGSRRNPELPGPGGAPPGSTLDPNTRVIEFVSIGVQVNRRCS